MMVMEYKTEEEPGLITYIKQFMFGNATGCYDGTGGGAAPTGTITTDPKFINYTGTFAGDYHLQVLLLLLILV